jgi:hypothetical protein
LIFDDSVFERIDRNAKLHEQTKHHPLSSCAALLNVIGSISTNPEELKRFLSSFGLEVQDLYEFASPFEFEGMAYRDRGYVIFEWIGPRVSPINETGSSRGQHRTSIDAFMLGKVNGKTTQVLVEWKFTEGLSRKLAMGKFCGAKGIERLSRYSQVLAELRKQHDLPFEFDEELRRDKPRSSRSLYDLSPDHLYQLLRMTLLAKKTSGMRLGGRVIEDYRVVHLTHSQNDGVNILDAKYLEFSPGLREFGGQELHQVWREILCPSDKERFVSGHWDKGIRVLSDERLRSYLSDRYA